MLKQITSIILINSLLFPQYVFAQQGCLTGAEAECDKPSDLVDSNTPEKPEKTKPKPPWPTPGKVTGKDKDQGQGGTQPVQGGTQPVQGETQPVQGETQPVQGETQPVKEEPVPESPRGAGEKHLSGLVTTMVAAEKFKLEPKFPPVPFPPSESGKLLEESGTIKFLGTSLFLNCQRQTTRAWPDMVSSFKQKTTTDMWPDSWWTLAKSVEQELEKYKLTADEVTALNKKGGGSGGVTTGAQADVEYDQGEQNFDRETGGEEFRRPHQSGKKCDRGQPRERAECKIREVKKFVQKGIARGKGRSLTLNKCRALVPSTSFIDYNSSEDTLAITPKASLDQKIACRSRGAETQDYPSCRKLVSWWDGFFIGKKLMETAQKVKYQMDAKDRQEDLALDMASKNPDPLLPLKMQKAGVDDQAAVAFQNSFFLGAQYAVMQTKYSAWPSREEIVQTCQAAFTGEGKKSNLDKAADFFEKFKSKKAEPDKKIAAEVKEEDPNLSAYIKWLKEIITGFDPLARKIQIIDLLDPFKKQSEIVASCPVPPMSPMSGGMGMGMGMQGRGMDMYNSPSYYPSQGGDMGSEEGEGAIGRAQYKNCDEIFMQNLQMDAQSQPQMPQGMLGGGAGQMMGGSTGYPQDDYGGGGGSMFGGGGSMFGGGGPGSEMVMGGMIGQSDDPCIDVMNSGTQLILNFQARENLKMVLVQTGIESLTNLMKAMMLRKQSAKIQSLIDGMPVPDPTLDKLSQKEEDLIASVCQIAPQEPICADFANRSNGFYSPNIDLTPPSASTSLARVKAEEQGANAIEKEMEKIAATELGAAGALSDASGGTGGATGKTPSVTFKGAEKGGAGGDITTDAKVSEAVPAAEKGAGGEETATPETGYTGGTEAREYKGPGFRADQYKGQQGGTEKIAGEYGSLGFREPSSEGISPKEAGGLFKIISDRYEAISKDHRIEGKSQIAK